jgi:hypothetical protein
MSDASWASSTVPCAPRSDGAANYVHGVWSRTEDGGSLMSEAGYMATFATTGAMLTVRLSRREKLAAARGDLRVPLAAIRDVRVHPDALVAARCARPLRTARAGRAKIGIWRGRGRRDFVLARRGMPAVCVTLDGGRHNGIVISHPDADAIAEDIRAAALNVRRAA